MIRWCKPCNVIMLMFNIWDNLVYCMNHILQGLSDGMKGGMKRYLVANRDYGGGFVEMLMDSILVHLMLVGKRDSLPLRLGSRWMCNVFGIWGFVALRRGMAM